MQAGIGIGIDVGGREVGFIAGMYKNLSNRSDGVFTGKGLSFGGSLIRPEATGYGTVWFISRKRCSNKKAAHWTDCGSVSLVRQRGPVCG